MSSIEDALLARAYPRALAARAQDTLHREASKGCNGEIACSPVALEPPYQPIFSLQSMGRPGTSEILAAGAPVATDALNRLRIWISPQQRCEWNRSELFLKQLS
ncbi:unnamed protein product, partial [marine sediment metagenome]